MSSDTPSKHMTSHDLQFLQTVLADAGYTSTVSNGAPRDVAAKLLMDLFQQGITDATELATELNRHFGESGTTLAPQQDIKQHRYAISGIPAGLLAEFRKIRAAKTSSEVCFADPLREEN